MTTSPCKPDVTSPAQPDAALMGLRVADRRERESERFALECRYAAHLKAAAEGMFQQILVVREYSEKGFGDLIEVHEPMKTA